MTSTSAAALASTLDKLAITPEAQAPKILTNPEAIAPSESWDDEAPAAGIETEGADAAAPQNLQRHIPSPPPPTPASPTTKTKASAFESPYQTFPPYGMNGSVDDASRSGRSTPTARPSGSGEPDKRPEKTTSTAARLIAAGLGQRAPKRTEEERKYDQAMKVQEKKKRDAAKAEEEKKKAELEQARKSIWED
ncbi:hypothetical protein WHR41_04182 [Cladosporium halotolerans]|uniref:Ubiquitin smt3 n=1 Tax=Cladosporium halotolerans TaxID=1052096 RepID=A0AB34KQF0_9PEZI